MQIIRTGQTRSDAIRQYDVLVDDCDLALVSQHRWHAGKDLTVKAHMGDGSHILIHRLILNAPKGLEVDHINGNRLDNRRSNLRLATSSQNKCNRGARKDNTSGYKGVSWHSQRNKWNARIKAGAKYLHLGLFENIKDAARAYNEASRKFHGEFAYINKL